MHRNRIEKSGRQWGMDRVDGKRDWVWPNPHFANPKSLVDNGLSVQQHLCCRRKTIVGVVGDRAGGGLWPDQIVVIHGLLDMLRKVARSGKTIANAPIKVIITTSRQLMPVVSIVLISVLREVLVP